MSLDLLKERLGHSVKKQTDNKEILNEKLNDKFNSNSMDDLKSLKSQHQEDLEEKDRIIESLEIESTNLAKEVLTLEQELTGQQFVPLGLTDYFFKIELDDKFLQIRNFVPDEILENQVAVYTIPSNKNTKQGRSSRQLTIDLKTFSNDMFNTYKVSGTSQINTYITVTGINSGARTIFPVTISNA